MLEPNMDNELFPRTDTAPSNLPASRDLALGFPDDDMAATPTLNLAKSGNVAAPTESTIPFEPPAQTPKVLLDPKDIKKSYRQEFLQSLAPNERTGLMLRDIGNALQGIPAVSDKLADDYRKEKHERVLEAKQNLDDVVKGAKLVRGLPADQQAEAARLYADSIPETSRPFFEQLVKKGSTEEILALGDKRVFAMMQQLYSDPDKAREAMTDKSKVEAVTKMLDEQDIPKIRAKLDAMQKMPGFEAWRAKPKKTFDDLRREIEAVKAKTKDPRMLSMLPTDDELNTMERNDKKILPAYGIFTSDMLAKRLEEGPKKDVEDKLAQILLKIGRGETTMLTPEEQKFLDTLYRADPLVQLRRDILGGKSGVAVPAAPKKLTKEEATKKLIKDNPGFTKDSPEIAEALKKAGY